MSRRFFDLSIDVYVPGRWYLSDPTYQSGQEVDDIWEFTQGKPVEIKERLRIPVYKPGRPLDIEFAGVGQTPIVNARVASVFQELAHDDIQLFPVDVERETEAYFLLNVAREIRCVDDAACEEVQFWTPDDGQPAKVGQYRVVAGLRIDKSKVGDARVFRPWGYYLPIIVDGQLKDALERSGIVGGWFDEV